MTIERKLDKIINILYDETLLHWKHVDATDFIAFAKKKFNIDWSNAEMNFILQTLINGEYIVLHKTSIDSMQMPTYSLTPKGVQIKRNGGFTWLKIKDTTTNIIIIWAAIFTIFISVKEIFYNKTDNSNRTVDNNKTLDTNQRVKMKSSVIVKDTINKPSISPTKK